MTENTVSIPKTCRYYTYGNTTNPKSIWFTLHGYGQLAKYFIKNFQGLNPEENLVIAPEGFHRFYLDGMQGRVGASWMTSEDRLTDISDYVNYIDLLYDAISSKIQDKNHRLIVLGFSQGVATASRWMALGKTRPDAAVFWAGSFPPDLLPADSKRWFNEIPTWCVIGDEDEYISEENLERAKEHMNKLGIQPKWLRYRGGHKIPEHAFSNISKAIKLSFN